MGTITRSGVGTIAARGVTSTVGMNGDGNGMGATIGEVDFNGALCVSTTTSRLDVDALAGGTFIRYRGLFGALFALGFAISFSLPGLGGTPDDIVNYFQEYY